MAWGLQPRERAPQVANRLVDPVLVFDQGEPHVLITTRPEPDAR